MTEDAAIRIDCDPAEVVHVPHTWSSSFAQNPRNLSHGILGTSPVSSELDIPNETDIPRVPLTASPTHLSWVARCHPDTTIPWLQPSRGTKLVPNGDGAQNILAVKTTAVYPAKGNCRA